VSFFGKRKPPPVLVQVFGKTDTGRTRDHNEDTFLVADLTRQNASLKPEVREHVLGERGSLVLVADGMGGAASGEVASQMAVDTIYTHMSQTWLHDPDDTPEQFVFRLREAVELANTKIHQYAKDNPNHRGMGTTSTSVGVLGDALFLTQVGDSRAYMVRRGTVAQLTKDQSLMQRLVDAGELTEEEAEKSERRNIILQALGPDEAVRVDVTRQELRRGDALILCSDGLSGQVSKEEIADAVTRTPDLMKVCGDLIDLANERGGPDNITVVVARFDGNGLKGPSDTEETMGYNVYTLDSGVTPQDTPIPPVVNPERDRLRMVIAAVTSALILLASLLLAR
jgi:PPM family protein phosphatase